jgi:poly [ADP-ribose] polymerase 7/11/12/13
MGGLFSGPQQQQQSDSTSNRSSPHPPQSNSHSTSSPHARPYSEDRRYTQYQQQQQQQQLEEQKKREAIKRAQEQLVPISSRPLHKAVLKQQAASWIPMPSNSAFIKTDVQEYTEYNTVACLFKQTTQKRFKLVKIERIQNPYLLGCYLLKKDEMACMSGGYVEERIVFHGTKQSNVDSICENNFNWRLHGNSIGNRYGKGVSFSPISYYASHYSDKRATVKVMFLVRILISNSTVGEGNMTIPPLIGDGYNHNTVRYDTAQKENGHVIVKFSDNEYYPEYLIHYTVEPVVKQYRTNYDNNFDDY